MTEFETIYQTYFMDVFLFMKRLSGSDTVAEEICSETFFKALRSIDRFRGDCDIRVWLCQIAKNCYYTYLKNQNRLCDLETMEQAEKAEPLEERMLQRDDAMEIHRLLHQLSEPYKEVFMLRVFGDLSFRQIGQIFQKNENWACVTYHRARQKIRKSMEEKT